MTNHNSSTMSDPSTGDAANGESERFNATGLKHLEYDEPVLGYHEIVAETAARLAPSGGTVADFGCGPGQILGHLATLRSDLNLFGLDGDTECLRRAKLRAPKADFVQGDIEALDSIAEDHRFNVIMSSHALEHLAAPVDALKQWSRFLAPGGRLVVAVPNSLQPLLLARALVRRPKANDGHYYIWDGATFENFCALAGFRLVSTTRDYVPLVPVRIRRKLAPIAKAERALLKALPQFSNSHIVVLEPYEPA